MEKEIRWDNSAVYKSFDDLEIRKDIDWIKKELADISQKSEAFEDFFQNPSPDLEIQLLDLAEELSKRQPKASFKLLDLHVYASTAISVDGQDERAKSLSNELEGLSSSFSQAFSALEIFWKRASDEACERYLKKSGNEKQRFSIRELRRSKDQILPLDQEKLLAEMGVAGLHSWQKVRSGIASRLKCEMNGEMVGISAMTRFTGSADESIREEASKKISKAWQPHQEAISHVLNSLAEWRTRENKLRSHTKEVHFLDESLRGAKLTHKSLETMMNVVSTRGREIGHRALRLRANALGKEKLEIWDFRAPAPGGKEGSIPYEEAMEWIYKATKDFHPDAGNFVKMMQEKNWIDASPSENRGGGAYCTRFRSKENSPRVFMTYTGTLQNVVTLAHELGHAFHNWVMRDIDFYELRYPMTLAETASTFFEALMQDDLIKKGYGREGLWGALGRADIFLLGVPMRYFFECEFYERKAQGENFTAEGLNELAIKYWRQNYSDVVNGDTGMMWTNTMHFSFSGISFYNYPYTFGYLFSQGIYAKRQEMGEDFYDNYVKLLRDCGRKTCEEVASEYLGEDLTKPEFWNKSLDIVEKQIAEAEKVFLSN